MLSMSRALCLNNNLNIVPETPSTPAACLEFNHPMAFANSSIWTVIHTSSSVTSS